MTRRERLEAKLEKRREWAVSRDAKSTAAFDAARKISSGIPMGQPILVGHHSEKRARRDADRIFSGMSKGVEHSKMADHHRSAAAGLANALDRSIFSDDPDAVEALRAKIAGLAEERDRAKAINKEIRKGDGWQARLEAAGLILTDAERTALLNIAKFSPYHCDKKTGFPVFPSYHLTSISANIRRAEERIKEIEARNAHREKVEATEGGLLIEKISDAYTRVTFADKPARPVLDALKAAGYFWSKGSWVGPTDKLPAEVPR
jgi:hypothetical protein